MRSRRTRMLALTLAATMTVAVAACGGGESAGPDTTVERSRSADAVTVEHRYGETTIEGRPERIVALDTQWLDVLSALDAPVVGAALDPSVDGGRFPWQDDLPDDLTDIPVTDAIPYEAVAALRPDLIVITWGATSEAEYERLRAIAPTIPMLGDEEVDAWQDIAAVAGQVLGTPEEAEQLVAQVDGQVAELADQLPELDGRTFALANYVPGDAIYVVADPDDGASQLFAQLGMSIDPELLEIAAGSAGRAELSLERIDELDADVLVLLTNGADPTELPGYDTLPAVQQGSVAVLDVADISGLNTPTPLSVPYSLELIRPALEAAAGQ